MIPCEMICKLAAIDTKTGQLSCAGEAALSAELRGLFVGDIMKVKGVFDLLLA